MTPVVRVTANLPSREIDELKKHSAAKGDTLTQGLKNAITTKLFLDDEVSKGNKVLVKRDDGDLVELHLP